MTPRSPLRQAISQATRLPEAEAMAPLLAQACLSRNAADKADALASTANYLRFWGWTKGMPWGVEVKLPEGYYFVYGGQFENMERAMATLAIIVPLTIAAIFFLLFILFRSVKLAGLIILVLPFASIGGLIGLFVSGEYVSVPASVGFIALWGIAVLNGVVLVTCIRRLREDGMDVASAVREGCVQRFRPVMMTATVALLGLVPFLFATGPGSEVQRPLAIVVIGGLISSTLLTLVVLPTLYRWFDDKPSEA